MEFEFGLGGKMPEEERARWRARPLWLKLVLWLVAYPAGLFIVYCMVTGRDGSSGALMAFAIFCGCALLHIPWDRRTRRSSKPD
jgi:hypothetical protein